MKKFAAFLLVFLMGASLFAQTTGPIKLALVAESDEAAQAVDVLTAQLSGDNRLQLLERDQIEKVYHEQGLSVGNRNDLQLGRILGADGILLLNVVTARASHGPPKQTLTIRLVAVKPGVILTEGSFSWPLVDTAQWAQSVTTYLDMFLPKLMVSAKDAIPLSVVNLRSAIQSTDELETERQLKSLVIQRLSQEPQFFVLEREKMQLLEEEKNLKSDESTFWDGSYLLDATVDQNGYSKDTITISARLAPPKGAAPLAFEVSGNRTNLAEVINALATNVTRFLKVQATTTEWSATNEAAQYYDEAKWALKWGINEEAQAAAESAWSLGKRNLDCALVRVRAYVNQIPMVEETNEEHYQSVSDYRNGKSDPHYVHIDDLPKPENLDRALYALEAYAQFSQASPDGVPKILSRGPHWNDWHNSDWYQLGIDSLTAASQVLQHYWFNPQSQAAVADQLADLRALSRSVAQFISQSPTVHDGYFVGDRIASSDELSRTMEENPSVFRCEVNWGCFWQETPRETISLYEELLGSPVFRYIHADFWNRNPIQPRLIAWNEEDGKNIPLIWENFVAELGNSTNLLWQMEAEALLKADATNDEEAKAAEAGWWNLVHSHRDELVANNVDIFYLGWGFAYNAETEAMHEEYYEKTIPALETSSAFEQQKEYLANFTPYDFQGFMKLFNSQNYTREQAAEIKPLVDAYESNMIAQAQASPQKTFFAKANANWIGMILGDPINKILNPPAPPANAAPPRNAPGWTPPVVPHSAAVVIAQPIHANTPAVVTNAIVSKRFFAIPWESLAELDSSEHIANSQCIINAYHWCEGKLLMEFRYNANVVSDDGNGRAAGGFGAAVFDPETEGWRVVSCVKSGMFPPYSMPPYAVLYRGELFACTAGQIKKYNFDSKTWEVLKISDGNDYELFAVNGHLYAANAQSILEIADNGESTCVLASTRRRPAVSMLDSLDNLGSPSLFAGGSSWPPVLFSGPRNSLCTSIGKDIYSWDGSDWRRLAAPEISGAPDAFEGMLVMRSIPGYGSDDPASLWIWDTREAQPQLALRDSARPHPNIITFRPPGFEAPRSDKEKVQTLWESPAGDHLTDSTVTFYRSNFYFFVDHCMVTNSSGHWTVLEKDGYHAQLVGLSRDFPNPVVVPLKFDLAVGQPPLKTLGEHTEQAPWATGSTWMHFGDKDLFLGQPDSPGIWAMSIAQIESAMASQKQVMRNSP